jgi:hypothetical protein
MPSVVTAVGRRLRPRNGEPHRLQVIAVRCSDGTTRVVIDRPAAAQPET